MIDPVIFPALLPAASVAEAAAVVVIAPEVTVAAGFVALTSIPETTDAAACTYEVYKKEHCDMILLISVSTIASKHVTTCLSMKFLPSVALLFCAIQLA